MRILMLSDEVAPFTEATATAALVRTLPEQLQESGDYEVRIMMPRYGTISERRNRLHEVIRLSGTEVDMGDRTETLKVKVASIPGIRLQVYFMDSAHYFKRKGLYADKQGKTFEDNPERALFFGRAGLETIRNLGWGPDVIHSFGWMSGFVPMLLRTEFAGEPLYENVRTVYTPNVVDFEAPVSAEHISRLSLPDEPRVRDRSLTDIGAAYADAVIYPPTLADQDPGAPAFGETTEGLHEVAASIYEQALSEVAA